MLRQPYAAARALPLAAALLVTTGCGPGSSPAVYPPTGVDGLTVPTPSPDPDDFSERIDNPWLPLLPGAEWVYETDGTESETVTVTVTGETRLVAGVTTTVVHDVVTDRDGDVVEDTYDWFAQDTAGNVWYFGEDTTEYDERGRPDDAGSWEAGVDGAQAGLAMLAEPRVGDGYRMEHLEGEAEDLARVVALDEEVELGIGSYDGVLRTEDTTPLEPALVEEKYYARGVGLLLEMTVAGGTERVELVDFTPGDGG